MLVEKKYRIPAWRVQVIEITLGLPRFSLFIGMWGLGSQTAMSPMYKVPNGSRIANLQLQLCYSWAGCPWPNRRHSGQRESWLAWGAHRAPVGEGQILLFGTAKMSCAAACYSSKDFHNYVYGFVLSTRVLAPQIWIMVILTYIQPQLSLWF